MILDSETNLIYFSQIIRNDNKYRDAYKHIQLILDQHQVSYKFLKSTKDIWCRDYMPLQVQEDKFIQFRYEPSYLNNYKHLQSDPRIVCIDNGIDAEFSDINLDGGNVISWKDKVIISDRLFGENPEYMDKSKLIHDLESLFNAEVIIIPQVKSDMTGHADGYVRFLNENTLIGNDLDFEYKYWSKAIRKVMKDHHLDYIDMPAFDHKMKGNAIHAIGYYMNYLEIGNLIVFPVFEVEGNKDQEALDLVHDLYPEHLVEPVNINEIAYEGGLTHCISWNIKNLK
jgi:agmatine deiminase